MDKRQATEKLKQLYKGHMINRDAFHTEEKYVQEHLDYILQQCGGTWDNHKAKRVVSLLSKSL